MGVAIELFEENPVIEHLVCNVCLDVPEDPMELACGHLYCGECLFRHVRAGKTTCPVCSHQIPPGSVSAPTRTWKNVLESLRMRCDQGCGQGLSLGERLQHLLTCPRRLMVCSRCKVQIPAKELEVHIATHGNEGEGSRKRKVSE